MLFQSVVEFIRTSFVIPHSPVQSQDHTVPFIGGCSCLWRLLPVPEAAGRSNVPARLFKGCILGMFGDELPGTGTWSLVSITLVQPVSVDAWKQLRTSACLCDLGKPKMNSLCQASSQHMAQWLLCLYKRSPMGGQAVLICLGVWPQFIS